MTSESLAKLYAEVVKVRPEAEVTAATFSNTKEPLYWNGTDWQCGRYDTRFTFGDDEASARMLVHWLSMLPEMDAYLQHCGEHWRVVWYTVDEQMDSTERDTDFKDSPIEALAAYLKSTGTEVGE